MILTRCSHDTIQGLRRLRRAPLFTVFSVVSLGVGIGATTAIYSVIHSLVLKPPAIARINEVVNLYHWNPALGMATPSNIAFSLPDYLDLKTAQTSFQETAAWRPFRQTLISDGVAQIVVGEIVEGNYFPMLGVRVTHGRAIETTDDSATAVPVVVLSDSLWRNRFGADPSIVGRTVTLGRHAFVVVGVAPPAFKGLLAPNLFPTALWVPLRTGHLVGPALDQSNRARRELFVKARMKHGLSLEKASAEIAAIGRQIDAAYPLPADSQLPAVGPAPGRVRSWHVMPATGVYLHESVHVYARGAMVAVEALVGLVLLIACTNIANLQLARVASRRQEVAVRLSLGASRWALIREHLVEGALLTAGGVLISASIVKVVIASLLTRGVRVAEGVTTEISPGLDGTVILAAVIATIGVFAVCGVVPALHLARTDLRDALANDNPATMAPRWRARRYLIAAQVAVSVALWAAATMCIQQIIAYGRLEPGFDLDRLAVVQLDFRLQSIDEIRARATLDSLVDQARPARSVQAVAISSGLPVGLDSPYVTVTPVATSLIDVPDSRHLRLLASSPSIFRVLGIRIVTGRAFDERDNSAAALVAVLGERAARALFERPRDSLGRLVRLERRGPANTTPPPVIATVIGVAADGDVTEAGQSGRDAVLYVPFAQHYEDRVTVVARTASDPATVAAHLIELVRRVDPRLGVSDAGAGRALAGPPIMPLKIAAGLTGTLGLTALILAMAGLYGVLSHVVACRTAEIGVRMALGASAGRIQWMLLRDGLRPIIGGLVLGLTLAMILWLSLRPLFLRLLPETDALILGIVPMVFLGVGCLAGYFPARRAARIDPKAALRYL